MVHLFITLWIVLMNALLQVRGDSGVECSGTICTRGRIKIHSLRCEQGTLLIQSVTGNHNKEADALSFLNLRRMCMGKTSCDVTNFCLSTPVLKVVYFCLNDSSTQCESSQISLDSLTGIIRNNGYPSMGHDLCSIRVLVPDHHFITITIHDIEKISSSPECDGDIRLRTRRPCSGYGFPRQSLCSIHTNFTSFASCGDVDIQIFPSIRGLRYLMTYTITKDAVDSSLDYLDTLSHDCPVGLGHLTKEKESASRRRVYPVQGAILNPTNVIYGVHPHPNITFVSISRAYDKPISSVDYTERAVFYIALAVAAISLTALIIVTAVCIRRQRKYKSGSYNIDLSRVINSKEAIYTKGSNSNSLNLQPEEQPMASLQEGYSVVADDIPYSTPVNDSRSPAYAEVVDNVPGHMGIFSFPNDSQRSSPIIAENVYSAMDGSDKNVYHEIPDEYPQWRCPTLFTKDYKQLIRNRELRKLIKKDTTDQNATEQKKKTVDDTTYVTFDNGGQTRSRDQTLSQRSDSDDSLVPMENEIYESFQSAHV